MILEDNNGVIQANKDAKLWEDWGIMSVRVETPFANFREIIIPAGTRLCPQFTHVEVRNPQYTDKQTITTSYSLTHMTAKQHSIDYPLAVGLPERIKDIRWVYVSTEMLEANGLKLEELEVQIQIISSLETKKHLAKDIN